MVLEEGGRTSVMEKAVHGGVLVVAGDDHGAVSSTMAHQSDQAFQAYPNLYLADPEGSETNVARGQFGRKIQALHSADACWTRSIKVRIRPLSDFSSYIVNT